MAVSPSARSDFLRRWTPPADWAVSTLGRLARIVGGGTPSRDEPSYWTHGTLPWATPSDLTGSDSKYIRDTAECITPAGLKASAARMLPVGTVLYTSRATLGAKALAAVPIATNQGFASFIPTEVNGEYLYYLLDLLEPGITRLAAGTTFLEVSKRDLRTVLCAIPSDPAEQSLIAQALDGVETMITRTRVAQAHAWRLKQAVSQRLLSHGARGTRRKKTAIGHIPESWEVVCVRDVVSSFQYGLSVPMGTDGRTPILRMGNIQNGEVRFDDLKYVSLPEPTLAPYLLRRGDVLFNRTNSQEWVGKVGIYRADSEAVFASYLIRLIHDPNRIDPYYLGHALSSYQAQCRIKRYATPGVQQVNINATNLGKVLIPVPTGNDRLEEQREIGAILEYAQSVATAYETLLAAQRNLRRALTEDFLSGRVRLGQESTALVAS